LRLDVGDTVVIHALLRDERGEPIHGSDMFVDWSVEDAHIAKLATANGSCVVVGLSAGATVIRASVAGRSATATVSVMADESLDPSEITIVVENALIEPIAVTVNGMAAITVSPNDTRKTSAPVGEPVRVAWSLIRPTDGQGRPVGEAVEEAYPVVNDPQGTLRYLAHARIGGHTYFAPIVRNETDTDLLIGVNMGLESENRCGVTVAAGTQASLGYYRLVEGSNVRGYTDSDYSRPQVSWDFVADRVDRMSGQIRLTAAFDPGPDGTGPGNDGT
jgi:hypothetical protein